MYDCMGLSRMEDMTVQGGEASRYNYGTVYNRTTSIIWSPHGRVFIT